ncbi:MAG: PAS domain S-box protein [Promethearchaeota archaeon]
MSLHNRDEQGLNSNEDDLRFRHFFENAPLYCYMVSPKGIILDLNKAALKVLGFNRVELIGKHIRTIYASESKHKVDELFSAWQVTGSIIDEEVIIQSKSGEQRTVLLNANAIRDKDGSLKYSISIQKDISELRQQQYELKESQEALKQSEYEKTIILDNISEHVIFQDPEHRIIWANRAAAESVNLHVDDILDKHCYEIWTGGDTPCIDCPVAAARQIGEIQVREMTTPDGRVWHVRGYPIFDEHKQLLGCVEVTREITQQKRAEEAYRQLVDQSLQGLFIIQDGKVVFINPAFLRISGYSEEEILQLKPWQIFDIIHPDDRNLPWEQLQNIIQGKPVSSSVELRGILKDGSVRWFELTLSVIEYQGKPATQAAIMDIHQRKMTEEVIRLERDRAQRYLDMAGVMFIAVDTEGTITLVNRKTLDIFGYTDDEMLGQNYFDLCLPERLQTEMKKIFSANMAGEVEPRTFVENPIITKEGAERLVSWHTTMFFDEAGNPTGALTAGEDITERKVAEDLLRMERDRAQQYLDVAGAAFIGINRDQKIFLVNRKGCEIFGYTEEELIGQNYFDLCIPKSYQDDMKRLFDQGMAGTHQLSEFVENPITRKNGEERIILWHTVVLKDEKGNRTGIISSGEDITERKLAEIALKTSEERFRSLVEDTAGWVWEVDPEGKFTYSNSSVEDILGYTAGQIIGRLFFEYIDSDSTENEEPILVESFSKQKPFRNIVDRFIHRDGNVIFLEATGRPIYEENGELQGFRGVCRDITQRMRADEILRESEARYRSLVETSPDSITLTDLNGTILLVNERTAQLLGFKTPEELHGKNCFDFIIPEERTKAIETLKNTKEHGSSMPSPFSVILSDGTVFPAEISASMLIGADGNPTGYIIVTRNITDRKAAERALEEAKARAEFFTDLMAHDLNNINQAILSALELQLMNPDLPEELRTQLQLSLEQVERSAALIGRVKKFSGLDEIDKLMEVRDIEPDFHEALHAVKQAFSSKSIFLDTNIHPEEYKILADELLFDLFFNVLHNAVKFDQNERVEIEVQVSPDANKRFLRIEISDHGPGIPDDLKERIFARYTQRVFEKAQGSGIGLTLVQRIVDRYGGRIWVEDRVEGNHTKGAKFVFLLPMWI